MVIVLAGAVAGAVGSMVVRQLNAPPPIRIGILLSLSGPMAVSEKPLLAGYNLAIDEINERGGLLHRKVEAVVRDGASDPSTFAAEADRLYGEDHVAAIFGCWTSASRKQVVPVVERRQGLLFYPVQFEGMELSPNVVYLGAAPNQQVGPAIHWAINHELKRMFLVGSDYVFPRAANAIIRDIVPTLGGEIVGEAYLPLEGGDPQPVVTAIADARPDVIINTINGQSNEGFFRALRAAGITPADIPTISFSIGENELHQWDPKLFAGDLAAWNYFRSIDSEANRAFLRSLRAHAGADAIACDPLEAAYLSVKLWAQCVAKAKRLDTDRLRPIIQGVHDSAPEGTVVVDNLSQYLWKPVRIGRVRPDGDFDILWESETPIRPIPYPMWRPRSDWDRYLGAIQRAWGGRWANPGGAATPPPPWIEIGRAEAPSP